MPSEATPEREGRPAVELPIDAAEELVKASSLHAQGELSDAEFLARRERLLGAHPARDPGER